jgi:hypothetical protein
MTTPYSTYTLQIIQGVSVLVVLPVRTELEKCSPSVTLDDANTVTAKFKAPDIGSDSQFVFELAVADSGGQRDTDSTTVTVKDTGGFSISCNRLLELTPNVGATISCTVHSTNGFNKPVNLTCDSPPDFKLNCSFDPTSVTPPTNGDATATLTISPTNSPIGEFTIKVSGSSTGLATKTIDVNVKVVCPGPQVTQYNPLPDGNWTLRAGNLDLAERRISNRPNNEGGSHRMVPTKRHSDNRS